MPPIRIIIFGCGAAGRTAFRLLHKRCAVLAFSDNNRDLHGTTLLGIRIVAPTAIAEIDYDRIVIASMYHREIRDQLVKELGISPRFIELAPSQVSRPKAGSREVQFVRSSSLASTRTSGIG